MSFFSSKSAIVSSSWPAKYQSIKDLCQLRKDRAIFVADFDLTLTTFNSAQCHDPVGNNPAYTKEFIRGYHKVMDTELEVWGKWWEACNDYLLQNTVLTRELFDKAMQHYTFTLREDTIPLLELLQQRLNVPVYIVSAGIKDVIAEVFAKHNYPLSLDILDNFVYSNYLQWSAYDVDDDEAQKQQRLIKFLPEHQVHSRKKHELPVQLPNLFQETAFIEESKETVPKYDVAIVLGDNPGDFAVVRELSYFQSIKIGFAKDKDHAEMLLGKVIDLDIVLVGMEHSLSCVKEMMIDLLTTA